MPTLKIAFITLFLFNICYAYLPNPHAIEKQYNDYVEKSVVSNLDANNIHLTANNKTTIQGSNLNAKENINIDAKTTDIVASQDISNQDSSTDHQNLNISFDVYGGNAGTDIGLEFASAGIGADSSTSSLNQPNYTNSDLQANNININTKEKTTIKGATLQADDTLTLNTKNLEVASVQNTSKSNSHSQGMSADFGASGLTSLGANTSNANTNAKQTLLTSVTGNSVDITVAENTKLRGATIAAIDAQGNDNGNLNLKTGTLQASSLNNTYTSKSTSVGVNLSGAIENTKISNVGLDYSNDQTNSKTKTLATIGSGNIQVADTTNSDTKMLNTDVANNEVDIYNISSHKGLKGELDTRLLTSDGQKQIAEELLKTTMITDTIKEIVTNETVDASSFFKEVSKLNTTYDTIKDKISKDETLAKVLNSPAYTDEQKNTILNGITNQVLIELGYKPVETNLMATTEPGRDNQQVKGFYSTQTDSAYVNNFYNTNNYQLLQTSATEAQRAMDAQNGSKFDQSKAYRDDRSTYSQNFGTNVANYTDFALGQSDQGSLSTGYNSLSTPIQVTSYPSIYNNNVANSNVEFTGLDKMQGDNFSFGHALTLAKENYTTTMDTLSFGPINTGNSIAGASVVKVGNSSYTRGLFYKGPYLSSLNWASSGFKATSVGYVDTAIFRVAEPVAIGTAAFSAGVGVGSLGVGVYKEVKGK